MTLTLGHVLMAVALMDLVIVGPMAGRILSSPDSTEERRRGARFMLGAVVVLAVALVLIALFLPIGRIRLT